MRMVWRVALIVLVLMIAGSASFVMWAGDPLPPQFQPVKERAAPDKLDWGSYQRAKGLFAPDYVDGRSAVMEGFTYAMTARRGPRSGPGMYLLSLEYRIPEVGVLERVSFEVSEDEKTWTPLGDATLVEDRGWTVAQLLDAPVSGRVLLYRATEHRKDGTSWWAARNVPYAPTEVGRLRDRIANLPFFRYLPDLR